MQIMTADEVAARVTAPKILLCGPPASGKTTAAATMPAGTLFVEVEDRKGSASQMPGPVIRVATWEDLQTIAAVWAGEKPAGEPPKGLVDTLKAAPALYVDGLTKASRLCLESVDRRGPYETKGGAENLLEKFGKVKSELTAWGEQLFAPDDRPVVLTSGAKWNDETRTFVNECVGSFAASVNYLATARLIVHKNKAGGPPVIVCRAGNRHGYDPVFDRTMTLDAEEPPHVGRLIAKMLKTTPASSAGGDTRGQGDRGVKRA